MSKPKSAKEEVIMQGFLPQEDKTVTKSSKSYDE